MKKMKSNQWSQKNVVTPFLTFLKTLSLKNITKICLPVILMAFLFSCKKDQESIIPSKPKSESNVTTTEQTVSGNAQSKSESCATTEHLKEQLASDPGLRARMGAIEEDIQTRISNHAQQRTTSELVTIPVVVHVIYNTAEQNISDAQIQSQIDVLNEDFTKTNADRVNTPAVFQTYAANANIRFVLAKRDPNGNATTGITRTQTSSTSFSSNNYVKFNSYGGHDAWATSQYLNIWVCNLGLCGYATYPGAAAAIDGVVVKYNCFGRTGILQTNYNKGRTATHEVSHWLNVYHIWGDGVCADDLVGDTPTQEKANFDYPTFPHLSSCSNSNGDMFMNFMDYSADGARNMMTLGQINRMNATLNGPRASILTSQGGVSPGGTTTTPPPTTTCSTPGGLNVSSITANGSILKWSSTGSASYNVRYKPTSSSTWINATASITALTIGGLNSATTYEFQVASVCSGSSSAFSPSTTFTTLTNTVSTSCNVPAGLFASLVTKSSASLNWASTGAGSYNIRYKLTTTSNWYFVSTSSTSLSLSGLSSSSTYEFQVEGVCSGIPSSYSASSLFTTSAAAVHGNGKNK